MKLISTVIGIVMILCGLLWSLQGAGYVGGSFMSGQPNWLYIGVLTALAGLALLVFARKS